MKRNRLLLSVLIVILLIPNTVFAMGNNEVQEMNIQEDIIIKYVYLDNKGIPVYDREKALKDKVGDEDLEVADVYFQLLNSYYYHENGIQTRASVPIYGNWCGPGYGSGTPIDLLDVGCKRHDNCYGSRGYHKCSCDKELASYIDRNISKMSGTQKVMAKAVRTWARKKGNNVDKKGKGGSFSCVL